MLPPLALLVALPLVLASPPPNVKPRILFSQYTDICKTIDASLSDVNYPLSLQYASDMTHWASSSSDNSACSVRPASAAEVGAVLKIVGSTKTPFAVKGGGHATNPGYSSTPGVHISLANFKDVVYNAASQTAVIGAGLTWDEVYEALEPHGVNVVGGRVTGVGVAGFTLGGGYSWLTNQRGLTVDNVINYELVLPNGTVTNVNAGSNSELFWGLKGGFNNYGIVTKFTMKAYPQGQVWGGLINIDVLFWDKLIAATADFSANNTDPKAAIISTFNSVGVVVSKPLVSLLLFYDGPSPPPGIFDAFLKIPFLTKDVKQRSYVSLVQSSPSDATSGTRGVFSSAPALSYPVEFLKTIANETLFWASKLALLDTGIFASYAVEPFLPSALSFAPASSAAYPPRRDRLYLPTNIYFAWALPLTDESVRDGARKSTARLVAKAQELGQDLSGSSTYANYAIEGTPLEQIHGDNLPRLKALKKVIDPENVMGLAGGWKF